VTRSHRMLIGCLLAFALSCSGAVLVAAAAVTSNSLTLRAKGANGTDVAGSAQFQVDGDTAVSIQAVHLDGGRMTVVAGPDASLPSAVDFPDYVSAGTYPRAVLGVTATSGGALSPGSSDFEYGAVFRLDSASAGRADDNGDNLFQRGRYGEASMFKLQVDHGFPSCLVKGSLGAVLVTAPTRVQANTWYSTTCSRIGSRVTVEVVPYGGTAARASATASASGGSGSLAFDATRSASVGGKLTSSGGAASSTDQFNGAVAKIWIDRL
jgi:hypothetical protein